MKIENDRENEMIRKQDQMSFSFAKYLNKFCYTFKKYRITTAITVIELGGGNALHIPEIITQQ